VRSVFWVTSGADPDWGEVTAGECLQRCLQVNLEFATDRPGCRTESTFSDILLNADQHFGHGPVLALDRAREEGRNPA